MITIEEAKKLKVGDYLYHETLKDSKGFPVRVKVMGTVKTWVRKPTEFRIPVKYGLYQHGVVTHEHAAAWGVCSNG